MISKVIEIIRGCGKCDGSRTQIVNYGDGGGAGIVQCSCVLELERYLHTLTPKELDKLKEEVKGE